MVLALVIAELVNPGHDVKKLRFFSQIITCGHNLVFCSQILANYFVSTDFFSILSAHITLLWAKLVFCYHQFLLLICMHTRLICEQNMLICLQKMLICVHKMLNCLHKMVICLHKSSFVCTEW